MSELEWMKIFAGNLKSLMEECFIIMVIDYTFSLFFYIHLQNIYN